MRWIARQLFHTGKMALHQAKASEKLIFAPGGAQSHGAQAEQFTRGTLARNDLNGESPIPQFNEWFSFAQESGLKQVEACTLSTAELPSGRVSSRVVYLKELDSKGFVIYSNFGTSRKAADLATNPHASLNFFWGPLQRQVRVEGTTERNTPEESQEYYDTRARGSKIGAWGSKQSAVLQPTGQDGDDGRAQLEGWVKEVEDKFEGVDNIPVPDFWGGLRIIPQRIEFWQGRESRLHDRFVYDLQQDGKWKLERLSP